MIGFLSLLTMIETEIQDDADALKKMMETLGVSITPKEEFEERYSHYQKNWKDLLDP